MAKTGTSKAAKSIYGVHPGVLMTQRWVGELKQKTGRTLEEWIRFIKKEGPPTEQARRDWLKQQHGLGTNSAWWLAERSVRLVGIDYLSVQRFADSNAVHQTLLRDKVVLLEGLDLSSELRA